MRSSAITAVVSCALAMIVAGCQPPAKSEIDAARDPVRSAVSSVAAQDANSTEAIPKELDSDGFPQRYSVVPYGYNYTDTYISNFEVNGAGGGNLEVSIPTAGGGKSACCMTLVSGLPLGHEFVVKWTRDRKRVCEQTVKLTKPIPFDPHYFEVHFYQDGHIEVEATQSSSSPRLKLDRFGRGQRHETDNVNNDEKYSRCRDGY